MGMGKISLQAHEAVVLMDTTYWGRNFGVVILMDASDSRVLWFKFIGRKERLDDYREGLAHLEKSGLSVKAVVSDGFTGLKGILSGTPYQLCQFHQLQRVRQLLTSNPKLPASVELKIIASALTTSDKELFRAMLESWHNQWKDFLKEKTIADNGNLSIHTGEPEARITASKCTWTRFSLIRISLADLCRIPITPLRHSTLSSRQSSGTTEGFPSGEEWCC